MKHSLQIEEGVPNWLTLSIVVLCAAPAITLNVTPRIVVMLGSGMTSNQLGIVLLVTLSALGMTCVPFAMKKAENSGFWLTCLAFGIGLALLNYSMAVGAIGKVRDEDAGTKQAIIDRANSLKLQITEARDARRSLPGFRPTSQEMVSSANTAVELAIQARDQECGRVGDNCRARQAQLSTRVEERDKVVADRSLTQERERLDTHLGVREQELRDLGTVPASSDAQASRLASALWLFGNLAPERVADGLISFLSICAEAFALGMPRVFTTALRSGAISAGMGTPTLSLNSVSGALPPAQKPTLPSAPPRSVPLPAGRKAPSKPKASIPAFKLQRTQRAPGRIRAFELYTAYKDWALAQAQEAESFEFFHKELDAQSVEEMRRTYYLDIAIKQQLKAVS